MRKGPYCDNDKQNISVVIYDTDTPYWLTKSWWRAWNFRTTNNPWFYSFLVSNTIKSAPSSSKMRVKGTV